MKHSFTYTDWVLRESEFNPEELQSRETVFTIGNGYLSSRGSFEEGYIHSQPATFIHGVYDDVPVVYTELVNCPDWMPLAIKIDGDRFCCNEGKIINYHRQLDLSRGLLSRFIRWQAPSGKTVDIEFKRFASMADSHVLAISCCLTPLDFNGTIEVEASINGYSENQGFNHWQIINQGKTETGIWLHSRTRSSRIDVATAAKILISQSEASLQVRTPPGYPTLVATFLASAQETVTIEKLITVFTSRDVATPVIAAQDKLANLSDFSTLLQEHQQAWAEIWESSDVLIVGDNVAALAVRYNIFQLLIAAPRHDDKVSIPAKTLSGFGYRGHIFWDTEIFILPLFIFTQPAIAQKLLTYRYQTLPGARRKAAHYGYQGAMYAWESAVTGDEVTPRWALKTDFYSEDIRIWCRDHEIHISSDIAYAIWQYWQITSDDDWMIKYGAEIILDTAIFWGSRVEFNSHYQRYEIRGVIGADEYHEFVHNNTFTNRIVQWHLEKALIIYDWLFHTHPQTATSLTTQLKLTPATISYWQDIIAKIWIPYDCTTGLIEQFEGFFQLLDINLEDYQSRTTSIQALLGIEATNQHQVLKQPDVLMLLYLMRTDHEFPYNQKSLGTNWDYYALRTDITYGSSLGPAIHSILASDLGKVNIAYERFMQTALVDLENQRGNTAEGIHAASAGGVWQAVVFGFAGIQLQNHLPKATPRLPPHWQRLKFKLFCRGGWHEFDITPNNRQIEAVIFDLDGVLTDTAEYHYLAWQKLADEEGIPFNRQANESLRGVSRRDSLMSIIQNRDYSESAIEEMLARKNDYYIELIRNITPHDLLPGAMELLIDLQQRDIKIGIGSASKNARTVIERLGITDFVDIIADGYSVSQTKPAPDLFLYVAQQLGVAPSKVVVVEDATAGVEAAIAAGMWAVGLGTKNRVGAAHVVLPSLAGITWADICPQLPLSPTI